ncbi:hypothetical protein [Nonomuraea dietziae]|uniref:Uncharacterized protein n=1 Tax=Nonomuraea dietziae TaxID=65515 RepID=A0A7W5UUJ9_9ACTN|nr:hypothetical protein [Nonomuraea dietziae]MBB3724876.1 hypothetical protein [Nonomuraea dietziae]
MCGAGIGQAQAARPATAEPLAGRPRTGPAAAVPRPPVMPRGCERLADDAAIAAAGLGQALEAGPPNGRESDLPN